MKPTGKIIKIAKQKIIDSFNKNPLRHRYIYSLYDNEFTHKTVHEVIVKVDLINIKLVLHLN